MNIAKFLRILILRNICVRLLLPLECKRKQNQNIRSSRSEMFCKKSVLRNFAKFKGKHLCQSPEACNFIKKETLGQLFSLEFYKISKNTFSPRHPWWLLLSSGACKDSMTQDSSLNDFGCNNKTPQN